MYTQIVTTLNGMSSDLLVAIGLLTFVGLVALAYTLRILFRGKSHFERVDKQGASALLSKDVMEGGYWFMQPLGRALTFCHITPNMVSYGSLIFGIIAGINLGFGHFGSAALFGTISAVLDALDGMVARLTGMSSDAGEVLDASVDRYVEFFMLSGLVVYYRDVPVIMILTLFALLGSFMISYSSAKAEALHVDPPKGSMRRPERAIYLLLGAALSPVTIPWLERVREYPVAIAHPMVLALCLIAVVSNVSAVERFIAIAKAVRARENETARAKMLGQVEAVEEDPAAHHRPVTR